MDELIAALGWLIVDVLLVGTGRLVVRLFSVGKWRGERLDEAEGRTHSAAGSLTFVLNGKRVVTHTGLLFVGVSFYIILAVVLMAALGG
ncbi:hypothetical protein [Caldimonas brevitalea]|uniref:Uncharacterized protein n=1 Tax=Caldimonas brevitalea TaxID=413882 RepID=A0A0G3BI55_9BURK|nr:hypothetical protein [Caldimonas brevitalea]AKJ27046.1 hypothetical protein AAW51_0355 [Caldimonas brevitalea]